MHFFALFKVRHLFFLIFLLFLLQSVCLCLSVYLSVWANGITDGRTDKQMDIQTEEPPFFKKRKNKYWQLGLKSSYSHGAVVMNMGQSDKQNIKTLWQDIDFDET